MEPFKSQTWIFVAIGALTMLFLQLIFVLFWKSYYSHFPLLGYEHSGMLPPFFTNSTQSLLVARIVLFAMPLALLWFAPESSRWTSTLGLWLGVMISVVIIWLFPKPLAIGNLWPIGLVILSFEIAFPLFLGYVIHFFIVLVGYVIEGVIAYWLKTLRNICKDRGK